jgi:hypothetical protein
MVVNLVARNANRLWWSLWSSLAKSEFVGSLESGCRFCVGAFGRNLASVTLKTFSHLSYFTKKCYEFCVFGAVCKGNIAINRTTVHHKKGFTPAKFDVSYNSRMIRIASGNVLYQSEISQ